MWSIVHILVLFAFIGILNLEFVVCPPGRIDATIPDIVVDTTIIPFDLMCASNVQYKKVFPVPLGPSTKKSPAFLEFI